MKKGVVAILVTLAIVITALVAFNWNAIVDWVNPQPIEQVTEVEEPIKITTSDVVAQRRMEIEVMQIDSVYYAIPEPALIAILDFIGVDTSRESVVKEYKLGKQYYDGVTRGAMQSKHFIPDSIPASSIPLKPAPVIPDTTRH